MEKHGVEFVLKECKDLVEEYKKTSKRAGYKDITEEPFPEDEEAEEATEDQIEDVQRQRRSDQIGADRSRSEEDTYVFSPHS